MIRSLEDFGLNSFISGLLNPEVENKVYNTNCGTTNQHYGITL